VRSVSQNGACGSNDRKPAARSICAGEDERPLVALGYNGCLLMTAREQPDSLRAPRDRGYGRQTIRAFGRYRRGFIGSYDMKLE
jgi:hypothetical protein